VLALLGFALPIRVRNTADPPLIEYCLQLADRAPATGADALADLERCSALVPDDVELLADLGSAYEFAGRHADAETVYRDALRRDPAYADVRVRLATLLLRRGAAADAREQAALALRIQPNRKAVLELLDAIEQSQPR
jgi:tetratricopeptide (TPR) repeat protein